MVFFNYAENDKKKKKCQSFGSQLYQRHEFRRIFSKIADSQFLVITFKVKIRKIRLDKLST